jgi:PAS domain S-box-containing protein
MSLHPANRASFRVAALAAGGAALLLLAAWLAGITFGLAGLRPASYLALHIMVETASVAFAVLLFAVSWNALGARHGGVMALGCGLFLAVAMLDFAHMLAFPGMPEFFTPAQNNKSYFFYLCARVMALAAMAAFLFSQRLPPGRVRQRNFGCVASMAIALPLLWWGFAYPQSLPELLRDAAPPTLLKSVLQGAVTLGDLVLALAFWRRARAPQTSPVAVLFCACVLMALSELAFFTSGQTPVAGAMLGHLYKLIAYYLLYRAVFVRAIRLPFELLAQSDAGLRESEERFRVLFETTSDAVLMMTADHVIRYANPAVRMFGYEPHELEGRSIAMLQPPELHEAHRAGVARYFATGAKKLNWRATEAVAVHRDGHPIPVEVAFSAPMLSGTQYLVGFLRDITERKRAEAQILELNAGLEKRVAERTEALADSVRELEAFSYSISHDLRAPLRGIAGFASLTLADNGAALDESGRGYLSRITEAAERMGRMIDALLDLSRIGRKPLQRVRTDLSALARQVAAELDEADAAAGSPPANTVRWEIEDGLFAEADPVLMRIVLENLLGNARKFSAGQAAPRIAFGRASEGGREVFRVSDNGIGFDMAYAGKLFKVFERLHAAQGYPGTGIGLATVQRIVQDHGGQIWARSDPGAGAAFSFTLEGGTPRQGGADGEREPQADPQAETLADPQADPQAVK